MLLIGIMKKLLSLAAGLLVAASAHANFYSDNNPADVWINALNPSYTGEFTLAGYNPAVESISWANVEFTLWDLVGQESVTINMSGEVFTHSSFSGDLYLGGGVVGSALVTLSDTGALSYTVSRTSGGLSEFWLKNAYLGAETSSRRVPDAGATSVLLGLGLMLIIGAKRHLTRVA